MFGTESDAIFSLYMVLNTKSKSCDSHTAHQAEGLDCAIMQASTPRHAPCDGELKHMANGLLV
jgi:hypothetical protein